jgi:hypothetical protein
MPTGVDLVEIGHGAVALRQVADRVDRRNVAIHRVHALEDDELRPLVPGLRKKLLEMAHVVVAENRLLAARALDALDHGGVVERVRQDQAIGQEFCDRGDAGLVRHVAGGEHEGRLLAVQVRELALQLDKRVARAGDVAGAAGSDADPLGRVGHGAHDSRVLPHAEIIVRAPNRDFARTGSAVPQGRREPAGHALELGKGAVATLGLDALQRPIEVTAIIHQLTTTGRSDRGLQPRRLPTLSNARQYTPLRAPGEPLNASGDVRSPDSP